MQDVTEVKKISDIGKRVECDINMDKIKKALVDFKTSTQVLESQFLSEEDRKIFNEECKKFLNGKTNTAEAEKLTYSMQQKIHPFDIPEILDMIIINVDPHLIPTSITSRLVCKAWNESWIRIVSKPHNNWSTIPIGKPSEYSERNLFKILKGSNCPSVFFQQYKLHRGKVNIWNVVRRQNIENLITEFGWTLQSLELHYCTLDLQDFATILIDYCPSLQNLKVIFKQSISDLNVDIQTPRMKNVRFNHLKGLSYRELNCEQNTNGNIAMFNWIIKASPNLKSLSFISSMNMLEMPLEAIQEFGQNSSQVKIKLDELFIKSDYPPEFLPFSKYLKSEIFQNLKSLVLKCEKSFPSQDVSNILKHLTNSLTTFSLTTEDIDYYSSSSNYPRSDNRLNFPYMSKLRIFNNFAYAFVQFDLEDFLVQVPYLEQLSIAWNSVCSSIVSSYDNTEANVLNKLFLKLSGNKVIPYLTLKELNVLGALESSQTPEIINQLFPNISKLVISFSYQNCRSLSLWDFGYEPVGETTKEWYETAFRGLTKMKKLRDLTIDFHQFNWKTGKQLMKLFDNFKTLNDLKYLTIFSSRFHSTDMSKGFVRAGLHLLSLFTRLSVLRFCKFKMEIPITIQFSEQLRAVSTSTRVEFPEVDPRTQFPLFENEFGSKFIKYLFVNLNITWSI